MSEQPKPLSAEEEARLRSLLDKPHATIFRDEFEAIIATLDAERARADAAERRVQKLKRAMEYVFDNDDEITSDHHRDDCPVDDGCESCRLGDIVNDAMSDGGIVAAEKSCAVWRECAGHLALVLRTLPDDPINYKEVRKALAEFDRLVSEATKGVEL